MKGKVCPNRKPTIYLELKRTVDRGAQQRARNFRRGAGDRHPTRYSLTMCRFYGVS